jgi:hypothetical protein
MSNGGSRKPSDIAPGEEAKIVLKVPESVPIGDGRSVLIARLKLKQIMLNVPVFLSALSGLTKAKGEDKGEGDKASQGYAFLGALVGASWDPTVQMLVLCTKIKEKDGTEVPTSVEFYEEMDAEPMLKVLHEFVRLHKRVAETFFGVLEEAGFPVQALRAWLDSLKTLMTSLGEDTDSRKSGSSASKS